jgi:hypothetical protein
MVSIRRRFELYVALRRLLKPDTAAYLLQHLEEIERDPEFQRHNRRRFESNPATIYNLYAALRSRIGEVHATTLFEMLDPLGWAADDGHGALVAGEATGSDHGRR